MQARTRVVLRLTRMFSRRFIGSSIDHIAHAADFNLPAPGQDEEEMLKVHEYAVQDAQQFLAQLRKHSRALQTASKRNNHDALLCEGLYALVLDLLRLYAQRKINQHQVVAGLQNVLRRHKQVASALTNVLQVLHSRINKVSPEHKLFCPVITL